MLWGKGKRFGTKSLPQTNPDPATDHGGGSAIIDGGSPTLVNFSEYLRKQLVVSKHLFNASQNWMNEDNPMSQKKGDSSSSQPITTTMNKTLTTKKTSKDSLTGGMTNKTQSKKKNKKKSKDRNSPQRPVDGGSGGGGKLSIQTPWENSRPRPAPLSEPISPTTPFMDSQPMSRPFSPNVSAGAGAGSDRNRKVDDYDYDGIRQEDGGEEDGEENNYYDSDHIEDHSPIKIKPIKATKKKIYTNQYIAESDTPGPGSYNIATSLLKPSFNRVFVEPPPATTTNHPSTFTYSPPNYLRQTTASLFRSYDAPCNHIEDKHSIAWESPTKQTMMYSMQAFKASKVGFTL